MRLAVAFYRLGKVITGFMLFLLSVLLLIICLSIFTQPGNLIIINAIEKFEPRISLQLEQGTLFDNPHFSKVSWQDQQNSIRVENVSLDFDWSCLLEKLCISHLSLSHADIQINSQQGTEADDDGQSGPIEDFYFPFAFEINSLDLKNIDLLINDVSMHLSHLNLQISAQNNHIALKGGLDKLLLSLPENTNNDNAQKHVQVEKKQAIQYPSLITPDMLIELQLPIAFSVTDFKAQQVSIKEGNDIVFKLNSLHTKFSYVDTKLSINEFLIDIPETTFNLSGSVDFTEHYPILLEANGIIKNIKQIEPASMLSGQRFKLQLSGDLSKLQSTLNLTDLLLLQLDSEVNLMADNLPFNVSLNWQNLQWPLHGPAQYASHKGKLTSRGGLNHYDMAISGLYAIENMPSGEIDVNAKGNLSQLSLNTLQLKTLQGLIDLNGTLDWSRDLSWDGELAVKKLDVAAINSEYSGLISGKIIQKGKLISRDNGNNEWHFTAPTIDLYGDFLHRPFTMQGALSGNNQNGIFFDQVILKNAKNRVSINGVIAEQNNLKIKANIVDLSHIVVGSEGSVNGLINIGGDNANVDIETILEGHDIHYTDMAFKHVNLSAKAILAEQAKVNLQLDITDSQVSGEYIDNIKLNVKNIIDKTSSESHEINLSLQSKIVTTDIQLQIIQTGNEWISKLNQASIFSYHQELILDNPLTIELNDNHLNFNAHCWNAINTQKVDSGKLCFKQLDIGADGKAIFTIDSYLLSSLDPFFPEALRISGALSADAQVEWFVNKKPIFDIRLASSEMSVKVDINGDKEQIIQYPIETFDLKISSDKDKSLVDINIYADNLINANINGRLFPYKKVPEIQASIKLLMSNLSPFSVIIPEFEKLDGSIDANVSVNGSLLSPNSTGSINFKEINMATTSLPIAIHRLNSTITLNQKSASIVGAFFTNQLVDKNQESTQQGKVNIKGKFDWESSLQGDVNLNANKMRIDDVENTTLVVSPNIHISYADNIIIAGEIMVDEGSIIINELSEDAIKPSNDVIVVDAVVEQRSALLPIQIDINLGLGEKLSVDAFGLNTMLKGDLHIQKALQKSVTVHGVLKLVDGSYRSLGQRLVIRNSNITFQGSPERPYLSLEAIRDPKSIENNVTAGVRVTGIPGELSLVIFSDPAMSQQDAISYITRGKSLQSNNDGSSDNQMTSMLINLGAGTSANALSDLGDNIGVDDLSLTTSGTGDEQSVDISGYIAPDVQLSYGVGVFDSFSVVAIRYEMFERFFIEASSGLYQALDAYYEFDWD